MKTYQVSEEFLIKAYEEANPKIRARLEREFPEAFRLAVALDPNKKIGSATRIEDNDGVPFFMGRGVVGETKYRDRCIVPCEGYTVKLVPNTGPHAKEHPTLVVFEPIR